MSDTDIEGTPFGRGSDVALQRHGFQFHGTGKEFFGIWIVNILLTLVTLGIYSAWAKVRTKRYFNGNTELNGHRFDYHANPVSILKGRIIVVIVLIVLNLLSQLHPILALVVIVFYALALPWVIVRGLRFNANMTSYRNLRFHFQGKKWDAAKAYLLWPIAAMFTLGALIPFMSRSNARFLGNGHSYGKAGFAADPPVKSYYRALGLSILVVILGGIGLLGLAFLFALIGGVAGSAAGFGSLMLASTPLVVFPFYLVVILSIIAYAALSRNIGMNSLALAGGHGFESTLRVRRYAWIVVTNALLTIVTIGLYIPWAKVRLARYLAANTTMLAAGDLDQFVAGQIDDSGVTSGEFLDIEGFDFGF